MFYNCKTPHPPDFIHFSQTGVKMFTHFSYVWTLKAHFSQKIIPELYIEWNQRSDLYDRRCEKMWQAERTVQEKPQRGDWLAVVYNQLGHRTQSAV